MKHRDSGGIINIANRMHPPIRDSPPDLTLGEAAIEIPVLLKFTVHRQKADVLKARDHRQGDDVPGNFCVPYSIQFTTEE